jgi:hypothetical protein
VTRPRFVGCGQGLSSTSFAKSEDECLVRCHGAENAPDVTAFGLFLREGGLFYLANGNTGEPPGSQETEASKSSRISSNATSGFAKSSG